MVQRAYLRPRGVNGNDDIVDDENDEGSANTDSDSTPQAFSCKPSYFLSWYRQDLWRTYLAFTFIEPDDTQP